MEKIVIEFRKEDFERVCLGLIQARNEIEGLKPALKEQDVPYSLEHIKDILQGAKEIEKFLYNRLEDDVAKLQTPELKKQQRSISEESFYRFLNLIRDTIKSKSSYSFKPAEVIKHFDMFYIENETLHLHKGYRDKIKESYIVYADQVQVEFIQACESVILHLNKLRDKWQLGPNMPLNIIFQEQNGQYFVNEGYAKDYAIKAH